MNSKRVNFDPSEISNLRIDINGKRLEGPIRGAPHTDYSHYLNGLKELKKRGPSIQFGEVVRDLDENNLIEITKDQNALKKLTKFSS